MLLGDVNKLFVLKSLLTMPSNVFPLHLKQTSPSIVRIFIEGWGDRIQSRLPFKVFSTLYNISKHKSDLPSWWSSSSTDILVGIIPSVVNMKGAKVSTNFIQHSEQKQNLVIRLLQNHCISLWKLCKILQILRGKNISICDTVNSKFRLCICRWKSYLRSKNHL